MNKKIFPFKPNKQIKKAILGVWGRISFTMSRINKLL